MRTLLKHIASASVAAALGVMGAGCSQTTQPGNAGIADSAAMAASAPMTHAASAPVAK